MSALMDALGFVGDTIARPGQAVRGLLAGRPDQLLNLLPGSETMGLLDPSRKVSGRDLNRMYGLAGEEDTWGNFLGGMATEFLTEPSAIFGGAAKLAKMLPTKSMPTSQLTSARRGFTLAKEADELGVPKIVTGGANAEQRAIGSVAGELVRDTPYAGVYYPGSNVGATVAGAGPKVARHEMIHGLVDQVAQGQAREGLPLAVQAAGLLKRGAPEQSFRRGLGEIADEAAAYGLSEKGLGNQLAAAGKFLFGNNPARQAYVDDISKVSPMAGALYKNLPGIGKGAVGLGGLGGGYLGTSALSNYLGGEL